MKRKAITVVMLLACGVALAQGGDVFLPLPGTPCDFVDTEDEINALSVLRYGLRSDSVYRNLGYG
ncbi:MAG: hypothetical protein ABJB61_15180 [bacterium]